MARDLFSVSIFFIVFRETIEAAIIISVLLSFVEQLMLTGSTALSDESLAEAEDGQEDTVNSGTSDQAKADRAKLIRRMRIQIWAGTATGFIIALGIGAAFIAVFYTKIDDLWSKTEQIWEGVFSVVAAIIIYIMGVAFLKMDRSRVKWRLKLSAAFDRSQSRMQAIHNAGLQEEDKREGRSGKWALFILPAVTVLREGLEAIVFVGGVSLGLPAASIPIPVVVGLIAGLIVGYVIYRTGSTATLHWFLIGSTSFLCLIGAGLMSKAIGYFQYYRFAKGVGGDVAETGDGPGSFQVAGNVWHLTYGNPETGSPTTNGGWQIFNAILGWNNTATIGSILSYVFYWLLIMVTLVVLKWKEGRFTFFGKASASYKRREVRRQKKAVDVQTHSGSGSGSVESPTEDKKAYPAAETPGVSTVPTMNLRD